MAAMAEHSLAGLRVRRIGLVARILGVALFAVVAAAAPDRVPSREIENIAAFARLYGVVRFFYPSDAAADTRWNNFAVYGVTRVRTAPDTQALAVRLRELFAPLGPGIDIAPQLPTFQPPVLSGEPLIAWRYLGPGATETTNGSPYVAKRTHRARQVSSSVDGFVGLMQNLSATSLRGKAIRFRGSIRANAQTTASGGALWLRVDRGAQGPGFFDNMADRPVHEPEWREYAIEGVVADDATNLAVGVLVTGATVADFDALQLTARDGRGDWQPVALKDAGFEAEENVAWTRVGPAPAQITRPASDAPEGRQFVRLTPTARDVSSAELFPDAPPTSGDHIDVELGSELRARVTLALTETQAQAEASDRVHLLRDALEKIPGPSRQPAQETNLADVVVAWNVYRHFYPYFSETAVDWDARLRPQLEMAYESTSRSAQGDALRRLVSDARDGHGRVMDSLAPDSRGTLPLQLAMAESHVVVAASSVPWEVPIGSVVLTIAGADALERLSAEMLLASGTPQWRTVRAAQDVARCSPGTRVPLIIDTGSGPHAVNLTCSAALPPGENRPDAITALAPDVWYVDLTRARRADLMRVVDTLALAKAVVFDMRGYPTDAGQWVLPHLIRTTEHDRWMHIAKIVGPFGQSAGWQSVGWDLTPAAPRFSGKVVFMTDARAISYAESVMGYVAAWKLGTIVGEPTAGTNGNIATFDVPGGFRLVFTGMRVTGHDGRTPHHLVGVSPDVVAAPTVVGLRSGHDEVLERALSLVR